MSSSLKLVPGVSDWSVQPGSGTRTSLVYCPTQRQIPTPVVVFLHGAGGTPAWALTETRWSEEADRAGFLLVLPQATPADPGQPVSFLRNPLCWNDGYTEASLPRPAVDDVGFLAQLLSEMQAHPELTAQRIYLTGFSNGGSMTFRAASRLSTQLAGIAPVACHCWGEYPTLARAVPTFYLVGGVDPLFPLTGGAVRTFWPGPSEQRPPLSVSQERWGRALGCAQLTRTMRDDALMLWTTQESRPSGCEFHTCILHKLGHHWPGGLGRLNARLAGPANAEVLGTQLIWDMLSTWSL